jgi:hypothetical protein
MLFVYIFPFLLTTIFASLSFPFKSIFGAYYLEGLLGTPHQDMKYIISLLSDKSTVLNYHSFNFSESSTYSNPTPTQFQSPFLPQTSPISTTHFTDTLIINSITLPYFSFYELPYSNQHLYSDNDILAFNYAITPDSSLTHSLYKNEHISHLSFSLIHTEYKKGKIIFGLLPQELASQHKYNGQCKVTKSTYGTWGCELSHVFIDDISYVYNNIYYTNSHYACFDSGISGIHVPQDFFEFVMKHVFSEYIKTNKCKDVLFSEQMFFTCDNDVLEMLPTLSFVFDGKGYVVHMKEMFSFFGETADFVMGVNRIKKDVFLFGNTFVSLFNMTFDYENGIVGFYSQNEGSVIDVDLEGLFPKRRILKMGFIILGLVLIGLFVYRWIRRKRRVGGKVMKRKFNIKGNIGKMIDTLM